MVIARFLYALPVFARQLTVSDMKRINAIFLKEFKWRSTTKLFKADDKNEHSDKQLFRAILRSDHCLNELLPPRKNHLRRNTTKTGRALDLTLTKLKGLSLAL